MIILYRKKDNWVGSLSDNGLVDFTSAKFDFMANSLRIDGGLCNFSDKGALSLESFRSIRHFELY